MQKGNSTSKWMGLWLAPSARRTAQAWSSRTLLEPERTSKNPWAEAQALRSPAGPEETTVSSLSSWSSAWRWRTRTCKAQRGALAISKLEARLSGLEKSTPTHWATAPPPQHVSPTCQVDGASHREGGHCHRRWLGWWHQPVWQWQGGWKGGCQAAGGAGVSVCREEGLEACAGGQGIRPGMMTRTWPSRMPECTLSSWVGWPRLGEGLQAGAGGLCCPQTADSVCDGERQGGYQPAGRDHQVQGGCAKYGHCCFQQGISPNTRCAGVPATIKDWERLRFKQNKTTHCWWRASEQASPWGATLAFRLFRAEGNWDPEGS